MTEHMGSIRLLAGQGGYFVVTASHHSARFTQPTIAVDTLSPLSPPRFSDRPRNGIRLA